VILKTHVTIGQDKKKEPMQHRADSNTGSKRNDPTVYTLATNDHDILTCKGGTIWTKEQSKLFTVESKYLKRKQYIYAPRSVWVSVREGVSVHNQQLRIFPLTHHLGLDFFASFTRESLSDIGLGSMDKITFPQV
jgi:hypothetical protein